MIVLTNPGDDRLRLLGELSASVALSFEHQHQNLGLVGATYPKRH